MMEVRSERDEDLYPGYRYCDRLREIFHLAASNPLYKRYLDTPGLLSLHEQARATMSGPGFDPKSRGAENRSWSPTPFPHSTHHRLTTQPHDTVSSPLSPALPSVQLLCRTV